MLIYFLQQCDPPVLPCLQDRKTDNANDCFIDGWDCYFDSELEAKLERQNTSSLGMFPSLHVLTCPFCNALLFRIMVENLDKTLQWFAPKAQWEASFGRELKVNCSFSPMAVVV